MVCVEELNTRSTVPFSTSCNKLYSYSTHETRTGHRFSEHCRARETIETDRATAIVSAAIPLQLTHMYVCGASRTYGSSRQASQTPSAVAHTSRCTTHLSHAASTAARDGQDRKVAARPRRCQAQHRPRRRQRPHRRLPACRRAGHVAADHQAAAATICSRGSQTLWQSAVERMSASAAVTGWVRDH